MTKYSSQGLLEAAAAGQTIVIIADNLTMAAGIFTRFAAYDLVATNPEQWRIQRRNGDQQIEHSEGGRILFRSVRWVGGGHTFDVAVLALREATPINELMVGLYPSMATSHHGDVVVAPALAAGLR